jgi:hypothetical protein
MHVKKKTLKKGERVTFLALFSMILLGRLFVTSNNKIQQASADQTQANIAGNISQYHLARELVEMFHQTSGGNQT